MSYSSEKAGVSLIAGLNKEMLGDFDQLIETLFDILSQRLGFSNVFLLMYHKGQNRLVLAKEKLDPGFSEKLTGIEVSLEEQSAVVRAFAQKKIEQGDSLENLFSDNPLRAVFHKFDQSVGTKTAVALPLAVFDRSIGVIVLISTNLSELSELELAFLDNFSKQIGLHVFTAWALKNSLSKTKSLQAAKAEYEELINIKKEFLSELQQLFVELIPNSSLNQETKVRLVESLMYLNAVMLLADSTINKHSSGASSLEDDQKLLQ